MFFVLSKVIGPLLKPLPIFFAAALVVVWRARREPAGRAFAACLAFLWLVSAPLPVSTAIRWWEDGHPARSVEDTAEADAIFVLGGYTTKGLANAAPERLEFGDAVDRLLEGWRLLEAGRAPVMVISGGSSRVVGEKRLEAPRVADWLAARGVDRDRLVVDATSRTTREGALTAAAAARETERDRLILVTSALHMRRAVRTFEAAGLDVVPYPVDFSARGPRLHPGALLPSGETLSWSRRLFKEWFGIAGYAVADALGVE